MHYRVFELTFKLHLRALDLGELAENLVFRLDRLHRVAVVRVRAQDNNVTGLMQIGLNGLLLRGLLLTSLNLDFFRVNRAFFRLLLYRAWLLLRLRG